MTNICIAVDAMGGDHGPSVTVPASLQILSVNPEVNLIFVGKEDVLEQELSACTITWDSSRVRIQQASQVVGMDELPSYALRGKKDSSMRVALNLVKSGVAKACVSAGNTGALMGIARFVLKTLPGIDRPAILFPLPSIRGPVHVLDLGANVDCQADHLFQFAVMGSVLASAVSKVASPKVGLLNVGSEAIKGTEQVKRAAQLLEKADGINYVGFIEGNDIYKGKVDVVVCDGFVGNIALKASEGLAEMMLHFAKEEFSRTWYSRIAAWVARPILTTLFKRFDPGRYNGGSLLGLQGVVIKSHGSATKFAFATAVQTAIWAVQEEVPSMVSKKLENANIL